MFADMFLKGGHTLSIQAEANDGQRLKIERNVYQDGVSVTDQITLFCSAAQLRALHDTLGAYLSELAHYNAVQDVLRCTRDTLSADTTVQLVAAETALDAAMEKVTPEDMSRYAEPPKIITTFPK